MPSISASTRPGARSGGPHAAAVGARLLAHFDAHRRDLPWRRTSDPYAILVSEVMLQQTRVETVIPYYERWLERFPTVEALAEAEEDEVLKAWEGLGYYRRARALHAAAVQVRERHAGRLPEEADALRALPGVGDYTAGAVASIAFGRPEPAVDGNVRRVLCRLFDLEAPSPAELRSLAASLVPLDRPGDFNQALMELGATVCTPRSPACSACPVSAGCLARRRGVQEQRPLPKPARAVPHDDVGTAVVVSAAGRLLLLRRERGGLLGGLWSFPEAGVVPGEDPGEAAARAAAAASVERTTLESGLGAVSHAYSHRRVTYHAWLLLAGSETLAPGRLADAVWVPPAAAGELALPVAQRKILDLAAARLATAPG